MKPVHWFMRCVFVFISTLIKPILYVPDIPIHSVKVLPVAGGVAGRAVRPGDRHVVARVHTRRDAHRRAPVQRRQRGRPDEQDRRGLRDAAWSFIRPGHYNNTILLFIKLVQTVVVSHLSYYLSWNFSQSKVVINKSVAFTPMALTVCNK